MFDNLWMLWDKNLDTQIDQSEMDEALKSMNFDGLEKTSNLEIAAYYVRNQNIACRPYGKKVLKALEKKEIKLYSPLQSFLSQIQKGYELASHPITENQWSTAVGNIFEKMCK